jgi:hypothetical protein
VSDFGSSGTRVGATFDTLLGVFWFSQLFSKRSGTLGCLLAQKLIYPDTFIWNELCDQRTDPPELTRALQALGANLVLGMNVFYEIVKTFGSPRADALNRGAALFSCLKLWTASGIVIIRQTPEILVEEVRCCEGQQENVSALLDGADCGRLLAEIDNLASGDFGSMARQFIELRKDTAKRARAEMTDHLQERPELQSVLRGVTLAQLPDWITTEMTSERGVSLLAGHVNHVLPTLAFDDCIRVARKLLGLPRFRISHGLVRSAIYLNWRLANRGSLRSDLPDDAYHVVSASYGDLFVTTEKDQADQALYSVPCVRTSLYDRLVPLVRWLPGIIAAPCP